MSLFNIKIRQTKDAPRTNSSPGYRERGVVRGLLLDVGGEGTTPGEFDMGILVSCGNCVSPGNSFAIFMFHCPGFSVTFHASSTSSVQ